MVLPMNLKSGPKTSRAAVAVSLLSGEGASTGYRGLHVQL